MARALCCSLASHRSKRRAPLTDTMHLLLFITTEPAEADDLPAKNSNSRVQLTRETIETHFSKAINSKSIMGCAASSNRACFPVKGQELIKDDTKVWMEERMNGSVTFRNWKTPNRRSNYLLDGFVGSLAVTDQRIVGYAYQKRQVNVCFTDERIQEMDFSVDGEFLKIKLDAGLFQPTWSGTIEYKFKTDSAQTLVTRIQTSIDQNKGRVDETK
jgi:hypothetical protein